MADASVTLTQSQSSNSSGVTYRGYVINLCDNSKVDDGDWDYDSVTGITASTNSNKITIWNTNTTSSSVSTTFTWTSSKVDGCTKTLSVTAEGAVVTLKSGNTEIVVTAKYDKSGTVYNTIYEDEFLINGSSEGIVTTLSVLTGETITTCNGDMDRYWNNYIPSTSNTNNMMFAFTNGLNTHLIGCSDDYNSSGSFTINLKYYDREMKISFPVTFNLTYKVTQYIIIFKKNNSTIESVELNQAMYTFDVYYRPKNSFKEQSASGIITSVSSSSTYFAATFNGNRVILTQNIGDKGDVVPDDIEFDVRVCIKPSDASSDICNSLPVHFTSISSGGGSSKKSITIEWTISYGNIMLYNNNTSIDVGLTNKVNSSDTSGSTTVDLNSESNLNMSVNFSMPGAGYAGRPPRKTVKTTISCYSVMNPTSTSGTFDGCCISDFGVYTLFSNGGIDCTSNFNDIAVSDGDKISVHINLSV